MDADIAGAQDRRQHSRRHPGRVEEQADAEEQLDQARQVHGGARRRPPLRHERLDPRGRRDVQNAGQDEEAAEGDGGDQMHARRLSRRREPGLERDERRSLTRVGGITVFSEPTARAVGVHAMPAWKLMLGRDAPLQVMVEHGTEEGWALLVPPGLANSAVARGAYTAVLIDPGYARGESTDGVVDLGRRRARHLVEELDAGHWTGLPTGTNDVLTEDESFLGVVLRETTSATTIERLSSRLGVSR